MNFTDACDFMDRNIEDTIYLDPETEEEVVSVFRTLNIKFGRDAGGIQICQFLHVLDIIDCYLAYICIFFFSRIGHSWYV